MKKIKFLFLSLFVLLVSISCTTTQFLSPEDQVVPLQSLAKEGDTILLIDATKESELVKSLLGEDIATRAKEITIQITPKDNTYPIGDFDYNAVVEGKFPFFTTNFVLNLSKDLTKVLEATKSYYTNDSYEIGVIHSNMVGVSSTSFLDLVDTVDTKIENTTSDVASKMYGANFALYSIKPKTLFDFGIGLNQSMISHFDSILLLVNEKDDNQMVLDATFEVDSEKNASTLDRMIKTGYTANLKKAGEKLDFSALKLMFVIDSNVVNIVDMPLNDEQINLLKDTINSSNIGL